MISLVLVLTPNLLIVKQQKQQPNSKKRKHSVRIIVLNSTTGLTMAITRISADKNAARKKKNGKENTEKSHSSRSIIDRAEYNKILDYLLGKSKANISIF